MAVGEKIPDVDSGAPSQVDEMGLSPAERTEWDAMQKADSAPAEGEPERPAPAEGDPAGDAGDAHGDGDADADADDGDADAGADAGKDAAPKLDKDGKPVADDGKGKPRTISYNKAERERKKLADQLTATAAERDAFKERFNRLDERTRVLMEAINTRATAPKAEAPPDPKVADPEPNEEDDPIGHASWTRRELGRTQQRLDNIEKGITTDRTERTQQTAQSNLERDYIADIEATAQADPTFGAAYEMVRESRYAELGMFFAGIDINNPEEVKTLTPDDQRALKDKIVSTFNGEQMEVARNSFGRKQSPSKYILGLARARGFDSVKVRADIDAAAAANGGAAPRAPAARAPATNGRAAPLVAPKTSAAQEVQNIRDGLDASRSLSDAGGSPGGAITADAILKMNDDEFADLYSRLPKHQLDALMGK